MIKTIVLSTVLASFLVLVAPPPCARAADGAQTLNLWPADAPGEAGVNLEEKWDHKESHRVIASINSQPSTIDFQNGP